MVSALKEGREGEELGQSRSQGHSSLPPLDGREAEKRDSGNEVGDRAGGEGMRELGEEQEHM